jgi:hypothetical protein
VPGNAAHEGPEQSASALSKEKTHEDLHRNAFAKIDAQWTAPASDRRHRDLGVRRQGHFGSGLSSCAHSGEEQTRHAIVTFRRHYAAPFGRFSCDAPWSQD